MTEIKKNRTISAFFWIVLFLINFGHGAGWAGVYSLLIKKIGSETLSYFFLYSAIGGFILNLFLMFFSDLLSSERLVQTSFFSFICVLGIDLLVLSSEALFSLTVFKSLLILLAVLIIAIPSVFIIQTWNLINKTFSPKEAAKFYPVLSTAPLIGSILGGAAAAHIPKTLPTELLIILWALCIGFAIVMTFILNRLIKGKITFEKEKIDRKALILNFKEGIKHYKLSSFALNLSVVFMSFWLLTTIIDFCYAKTLDKTFSSSSEIASFIGKYTMAANITALLIQTFLGSKLLKKTGVRNGFLFLPCSQIICLIFMIFSPGLIPVAATMFMQTLIGMSIQSNSIQVSFNVFASSVRGKIRTLLEGVINPLGGVIGSLTIIVIDLFQKNASVPVESVLPYFGIFFSFIWLYFVLKIKRSYLKEILWTYFNGTEQDRKDAVEALQIEKIARQ